MDRARRVARISGRTVTTGRGADPQALRRVPFSQASRQRSTQILFSWRFVLTCPVRDSRAAGGIDEIPPVKSNLTSSKEPQVAGPFGSKK
jgi:hypothetical protein